MDLRDNVTLNYNNKATDILTVQTNAVHDFYATGCLYARQLYHFYKYYYYIIFV